VNTAHQGRQRLLLALQETFVLIPLLLPAAYLVPTVVVGLMLRCHALPDDTALILTQLLCVWLAHFVRQGQLLLKYAY
jgi:hypothetical protein